jgi:hypothetical protein
MGRPPLNRKCGNDWCDRKHFARGFCHTCYYRGWSSGDMSRAATVHREWELSRVDVDAVVVTRLVNGDPPERTTLGEREAAVRHLHGFGLNDREIATRTRIPKRTVWGIRQRLSLPPRQRGRGRLSQVYFTDHFAVNRRPGGA